MLQNSNEPYTVHLSNGMLTKYPQMPKIMDSNVTKHSVNLKILK